MFKSIFKTQIEIQKETVKIKSNAEMVEEIHNHFYTAAEKLLASAKEVLADCEARDLKKGERLLKLGFRNTPQAIEKIKTKEVSEKAEKLAKHIQHYTYHYPNNKFITQSMVQEICKNYGLVCGDVELYKGFVPVDKLEEIEKFVLREEDHIFHKPAYGSLYYSIRNILEPGNSNEVYDNGITYEDYQKGKNLRYSNEDCCTKEKPGLKICAPIKDMDTTGMKLEDGYKIVAIDPVVLQPVRGGYLILAAWGDEASDPLVVNHRNN
jgi:hypothetical protein